MKKLMITMAAFALVASGCQNSTDETQDLSSGGQQVQSGEVNGQAGAGSAVDAQDYIKEGLFTDPVTDLSFNLPKNQSYYVEMSEEQGAGNLVSYRIQNYSAEEDKLSLGEDEFYIELWIDEEGSTRFEADCDGLSSLETKELSEGSVLMGYPDQGGDSGGERYAFCSGEGSPYVYYLQITDNHPLHPVKMMINKSLRVG